MVDRLVRAGAVRPSTDTEDRRRSQLHITEAGRAHLRQIRLGARDELTRKLAARSAEELKTLQDGLAVLRLAFQPE
jgi:DNA-binding MarR family transcriptional regulator